MMRFLQRIGGGLKRWSLRQAAAMHLSTSRDYYSAGLHSLAWEHELFALELQRRAQDLADERMVRAIVKHGEPTPWHGRARTVPMGDLN